MSQVELAIGAQISLDIDELNYFQGDLKDLSFQNYERLKRLILKHKFAFAPHVWHFDNKWWILDGHQRYRVLKKMKEEGSTIPKIPCTQVHAHDYKSAKELVLAGTSQFGEITGQGLYEFIGESGLDWREVVEENRFAEIEPTTFVEEFYGESLNPGGAGGSGGTNEDAPKIEVYPSEEIAQDAFTYFRQQGFPYPFLELHEQKQELNRLANLDRQSLLRSTVGYKVADTYHPHRFSAAAIKMCSPVESFADDKKLNKAIRWHMQSSNLGTDFFGTLSIVNGTQACSNFRPAFAKYLYDEYCPKGGTVFDSSTGYGGRLVGFLASHCGKYVGTDPNVPTYKANCEIASMLGGHKDIELFNSPIEDLETKDMIATCDLAFTSPPYFIKEIYSTDETQSCQRYRNYDDWINKFLVAMLKQQFSVLKGGCMNIVNIEDVRVDGKLYPLVEPTIEIAKSIGFDLINVEKFELQSRTMLVDGEKQVEEAFESVIILRKQ